MAAFSYSIFMDLWHACALKSLFHLGYIQLHFYFPLFRPPSQKSYIGWIIVLFLVPPVYPLAITALVWTRRSKSYTDTIDYPRAWLYYRRAQRTCLAAYVVLLFLLLAVVVGCAWSLKKNPTPESPVPTPASPFVDTLGLLGEPLVLNEPDLDSPTVHSPSPTLGTSTEY